MVCLASRSRFSHLPVNSVCTRPGYVFILAVLGIGIVVASTTFSLMLLGWAAEQNGVALEQAAQALSNAHTCAERALLSLRDDSGYNGGEVSVVLTQGTCSIEPIVGTGNADRSICVSGQYGESVRRIEIDIATLLPQTIVRTWKEVSSFTLCPTTP